MKQLPVIVTALVTMLAACWGEPLDVEFVSYGEVTARDNNLAAPAYQSDVGGWSENRIIFGDRDHVDRVRPYVRANLALSSENIAEENTLTYGVGAEIRPFAYRDGLRAPGVSWIRSTRCYAEVLGQTCLRDEKPAWNPEDDIVIGLDLWHEFGAADRNRVREDDRYWGELFLGAAYHTTDFYLSNYDSIRMGLNVRAGAVLDHIATPVMPYLVLDINATSAHSFHWQNRMWGGVGLRTERRLNARDEIRLFVEQRWLIDYLKDEPIEDIPDSDVVLGVTYEFNRY